MYSYNFKANSFPFEYLWIRERNTRNERGRYIDSVSNDIPSAYFNQLWIDVRVLMCYKQAAAYYIADAVTSPSRFQIRSIRAVQACARRAVSLNIAPETTSKFFLHKSARAKIHLSIKCNRDFATTRARRTSYRCSCMLVRETVRR